MVERIEDASEVAIIGKFYDVPTVKGTIDVVHGIWVVRGQLHEDADILNFPYQHWHLDERFLSGRLYAALMRRSLSGAASIVLHSACASSGVVRRRRKCRRHFSYPQLKPPWCDDLQKAFAGKSWSGEQRRCPHRGAELATVKPVKGIVRCPLHGLCFSAKTGVVLPSFEVKLMEDV